MTCCTTAMYNAHSVMMGWQARNTYDKLCRQEASISEAYHVQVQDSRGRKESTCQQGCPARL